MSRSFKRNHKRKIERPWESNRSEVILLEGHIKGLRRELRRLRRIEPTPVILHEIAELEITFQEEKTRLNELTSRLEGTKPGRLL